MTEHSTLITEGTGEEHEASLKMCKALALLSCKQNLSVLTVGWLHLKWLEFPVIILPTKWTIYMEQKPKVASIFWGWYIESTTFTWIIIWFPNTHWRQVWLNPSYNEQSATWKEEATPWGQYVMEPRWELWCVLAITLYCYKIKCLHRFLSTLQLTSLLRWQRPSHVS